MYIITQHKEHCSDAEQVIYYCESLEQAIEVARDIASETGETMQILQLITTVSSEETYEPDYYQQYKDEQCVQQVA